MGRFEVDVNYLDRMFDTVTIEGVEDKDEAEFQALNEIRDANPEATSLDVTEVREIG